MSLLLLLHTPNEEAGPAPDPILVFRRGPIRVHLTRRHLTRREPPDNDDDTENDPDP